MAVEHSIYTYKLVYVVGAIGVFILLGRILAPHVQVLRGAMAPSNMQPLSTLLKRQKDVSSPQVASEEISRTSAVISPVLMNGHALNFSHHQGSAASSSGPPTTLSNTSTGIPPTITLHLPHGARMAALLPGNIDSSSAKTVDLWSITQKQTFGNLGCMGKAACPALSQCGQQRYLCIHNPLNATLPDDFPMKEDYPEAYLDTTVFVLNNVLQEWNGNVVGLQKGNRPIHYWLGMCPWGNINAAKADILSMTLHLTRAASLVHVYAVNFYHFMAETLPKYYALLPLLRAYPDTQLLIAHKWNRLVDLFFPDDKLSVRSVNLKMWGAGKPKTKPKKDSNVYKYVFVHQFFAALQPKCGLPPMTGLAELRSDYLRNIRSRIVDHLESPGLILLYVRNNFTHRRALRENEALHSALVQQYDANLVQLWYGIWPARLKETIAPLAQASVLVGPHGAGLAAMLFLPPGGSILEIRQDYRRDLHSCFELMAYGASIPFGFIFGHGTRDTPMSVNVTAVVERVRQMREEHWLPFTRNRTSA